MSDINQPPQGFAPPPPPLIPAPSSGLAPNVAGTLAYITVIPAILFLVLEPHNRNPFIRFHALQCIGLFLAGFVTSLVMIIPILGWLFALVMFPTLFVCWLLSIFNAYQGRMFKVPLIGQIAANMAK